MVVGVGVVVLVGVLVKVALAPGWGVSVIDGVEVGRVVAVHGSVEGTKGVQVREGTDVSGAGARINNRIPVQ